MNDEWSSLSEGFRQAVNAVSPRIPFISVPNDSRSALGEMVDGTRIYRCGEVIHSIRSDEWSDAVHSLPDDLVSPGGAGMYGLSRLIAHRLARLGLLTMFLYYEARESFSLWNWKKCWNHRSPSQGYISGNECAFWNAQLQEFSDHGVTFHRGDYCDRSHSSSWKSFRWDSKVFESRNAYAELHR